MSLSGFAKKVQDTNRSYTSPSPPRSRPSVGSSSSSDHINVKRRKYNNEPIRTLSSGNDEDSPFSDHNDTTLSCPHCKRSFSAPASLQNYNIVGHQEIDLPKNPNLKDELTTKLPPEAIEEKVKADQEKLDGPRETVESKKVKKKRSAEEAQVSNSQLPGNGGRNKSKQRKN